MKKLLMLLIVAGAAFSCTDDDLKPEGDFTGEKIVGFASNLQSISYFADEGPVEREFAVNLIGLGNGQVATEDIVVNYTIDTENSTAVEGREFDFQNTSGQVVIPAGSTFGMFPLLVNTGNLDENLPTQLVVKLSSASGAVVGAQYNTIRIVFVGCVADIAGTYSVSVLRESTGATLVRPNETITETGINKFMTSSSGTLANTSSPDPSRAGFHFEVLCGDIVVPSQGLFDGQYPGNEVVGVPFADGALVGLEGKVIDENTFKIRYKANYGGATGFVTFVATYTRQ